MSDDLTDLFDEAVKGGKKGRRLDTTNLNANLKSLVEYLRTEAEHIVSAARVSNTKLPPIHVDFIDSDEVNAFAFPYKNYKFVGITLALVAVLNHFTRRIAADKRILTVAGLPNRSMETAPLSTPLAQSLLDDFRLNGMQLIVDKERDEYKDVVMAMTFHFIFLHELGHIRNGHVDYSHSKRGVPFLDELCFVPKTPEESIERQAIETDADSYAMAMMTESIVHWAKMPPGPNPYFETFDSILFTVLFSIFSFFRLFDDKALADLDLYKSSHPPFRMRLGNVKNVLKSQFEGGHGVSYRDLQKAIGGATFETEQAYHFLTGLPITRGDSWETDRYTEAFGAAGREHREKIKQCWNGGLRQALVNCGYGDITNYDD